jgi:hypothetical protein
MQEIKQYGPYDTTHKFNNLDYVDKSGKMPILNREYNPYIDAFWKWWPELSKSLSVFRITGGEPLLSKETWKIFDLLIEKNHSNMLFAINSNMCVEDELIDKFIEKSKLFKNNVKKFTLFTSAESFGNQAEYVRFGMNFDKFIKNVDKYLASDDEAIITFMTTLNLLSLPSLKEFMAVILDLRKKYNTNSAYNRVGLSLNYLRWPEFLDIRLLPNDLKISYFEKLECYVNLNLDSSPHRFYLEEKNKIERLRQYAFSDISDKEIKLNDLKIFISQYDQRRNTNFNEVFPELRGIFDV